MEMNNIVFYCIFLKQALRIENILKGYSQTLLILVFPAFIIYSNSESSPGKFFLFVNYRPLPGILLKIKSKADYICFKPINNSIYATDDKRIVSNEKDIDN